MDNALSAYVKSVSRALKRGDATEHTHRPALKALLAHDGPAVLEFIVDRDAHVFPMIGPGQGYKEMILGPLIPSRERSIVEED